MDANNSINKFNEDFNRYISSVRSNSYLFEVNKCCGYCEISPINKSATCADLYKSIISQFYLRPENQIRVYAVALDLSGNRLFIQNNDKSIKDLIMENNNYFKPIYPLPVDVVYKLIFDDCSQCPCLTFASTVNG
jgi:hypothetical protein